MTDDELHRKYLGWTSAVQNGIMVRDDERLGDGNVCGQRRAALRCGRWYNMRRGIIAIHKRPERERDQQSLPFAFPAFLLGPR